MLVQNGEGESVKVVQSTEHISIKFVFGSQSVTPPGFNVDSHLLRGRHCMIQNRVPGRISVRVAEN